MDSHEYFPFIPVIITDVMKLLQTAILHYKTNQEECTNGKKLRKRKQSKKLQHR